MKNFYFKSWPDWKIQFKVGHLVKISIQKMTRCKIFNWTSDTLWKLCFKLMLFLKQENFKLLCFHPNTLNQNLIFWNANFVRILTCREKFFQNPTIRVFQGMRGEVYSHRDASKSFRFFRPWLPRRLFSLNLSFSVTIDFWSHWSIFRKSTTMCSRFVNSQIFGCWNIFPALLVK